MVVIFLVIAIGLGTQLTQPTPAQAGVVAGVQTSKPVEVKKPTATQASAPTVTAPSAMTPTPAVVTPTPVATPSCQMNGNYQSSPSPVNLGSYEQGLVVLRDPVSYYQVYGDTRSEVNSQIRACGPQHEYAGQTGYSLNWSYALRADETGLCRVVSAKVGVHTTMLLPDRQLSGNESRRFSSAWQSFAAGLRVHEFGHVTLAEQYGARLLASLQSYPAGDCYSMGPGVEAVANGVATQLNSAQINYDGMTNHGVSQGALF